MVCASLSPIHTLPHAGDPADTDYTAVGCAVTTISSNLTEMSKGVKLLAALMEDEGGNGRQLLQAAKNLASAVSDLLKTAQPASAEVGAGPCCWAGTGEESSQAGQMLPWGPCMAGWEEDSGGLGCDASRGGMVLDEGRWGAGTRHGAVLTTCLHVPGSHARTCCRRPASWARQAGSCCSRSERATPTRASR